MSRFYNLELIKKVPIDEIAEMLGYKVIQKNNSLWVNIRDEKTPSCKLYKDTNTFCDFGDANRGGDVITFVQVSQNIEKQKAIELIADNFGIEPIMQNKEHNISDTQYKKIGIEPENVLCNIDYESLSIEQLEKLSRYNVSVNELRKNNIIAYEMLLRKKALPFITELRKNYYYNLYCENNLANACGFDLIKLNTSIDNLKKYAKTCEESEKILEQAIFNKDDFKFKRHDYNVIKDIEDIRSGKINVEIGNYDYSKIQEQKEIFGENIKYQKITLEEYNKYLSQIFDEEVKIAAFLQGDIVNIAYLESQESKVKRRLHQNSESIEQNTKLKKYKQCSKLQ